MGDAQFVLEASRHNCSQLPVVTARYLVEVVVNEAYYGETEEEHKDRLAQECQRALDAGYFEDLRYDALVFDVLTREVLEESPANYPDETTPGARDWQI